MATAAAKKKPSTLRAYLGQIMDEEATLDATRQIVLDALGAQTSRKVRCPDCGTEFRAPQPDLKKQVDTLIALLQEKEGRPAVQQQEGVTVLIQRPPL